jgi:hypothetical protein
MDIPDILVFFGGRVDPEEARQALEELLRQRGYVDGELTREQVLELLEILATRPGAFGISARFAKIRAILKR